jgi:hypothetical protein
MTRESRKQMALAYRELDAPRPLDDDEKRSIMTAGRRAGSLAAFAELIGMHPKTVWRALHGRNRHRSATLEALLSATPLFNRAYELGAAAGRAEAEEQRARLERENAHLRRLVDGIQATLDRRRV